MSPVDSAKKERLDGGRPRWRRGDDRRRRGTRDREKRLLACLTGYGRGMPTGSPAYSIGVRVTKPGHSLALRSVTAATYVAAQFG